jgi:hypothetical protein
MLCHMKATLTFHDKQIAPLSKPAHAPHVSVWRTGVARCYALETAIAAFPIGSPTALALPPAVLGGRAGILDHRASTSTPQARPPCTSNCGW